MTPPPTPQPSSCTCTPCPHCRKQEAAWQRIAEQEREGAIEEAGGVGNWLADERERAEDYSWDVGSSQL